MPTVTVEWQPDDPLPKGKTDQIRMDNMTEEEIEAKALDDPDSIPMTEEEWRMFERKIP